MSEYGLCVCGHSGADHTPTCQFCSCQDYDEIA